jgi:hypothetical protein
MFLVKTACMWKESRLKEETGEYGNISVKMLTMQDAQEKI